MIKVQDEKVKTAFYFALKDTLVGKDLEQATRISDKVEKCFFLLSFYFLKIKQHSLLNLLCFILTIRMVEDGVWSPYRDSLLNNQVGNKECLR